MSLSEEQQREGYRRMLRIRRFEQEGTRLFKEGQIPGAYHASIGQEAAIVGACMALRDDDYIDGHAPLARPSDRQGRRARTG